MTVTLTVVREHVHDERAAAVASGTPRDLGERVRRLGHVAGGRASAWLHRAAGRRSAGPRLAAPQIDVVEAVQPARRLQHRGRRIDSHDARVSGRQREAHLAGSTARSPTTQSRSTSAARAVKWKLFPNSSLRRRSPVCRSGGENSCDFVRRSPSALCRRRWSAAAAGVVPTCSRTRSHNRRAEDRGHRVPRA